MMTPEHVACTRCRKWFRPSVLKRWNHLLWCADCFPRAVS
jgi:hypothetical protein